MLLENITGFFRSQCRRNRVWRYQATIRWCTVIFFKGYLKKCECKYFNRLMKILDPQMGTKNRTLRIMWCIIRIDKNNKKCRLNKIETKWRTNKVDKKWRLNKIDRNSKRRYKILESSKGNSKIKKIRKKQRLRKRSNSNNPNGPLIRNPWRE